MTLKWTFPPMKQALRAHMSEKRSQLSPLSYAEKSRSIKERLESLDEFKRAQWILIYLSKGSEVSTRELFESLINEDKHLVAPRVNGSEIELYEVLSDDDLEEGRYSIQEPKQSCQPVKPEQIELAIIPGLAFSPEGHRLGYGKGYYDALLKRTNALKVALAFEEQMTEVPTEEHDVNMDLIITDQNTYHP